MEVLLGVMLAVQLVVLLRVVLVQLALRRVEREIRALEQLRRRLGTATPIPPTSPT